MRHRTATLRAELRATCCGAISPHAMPLGRQHDVTARAGRPARMTCQTGHRIKMQLLRHAEIAFPRPDLLT
jgi:hypothetical protein